MFTYIFNLATFKMEASSKCPIYTPQPNLYPPISTLLHLSAVSPQLHLMLKRKFDAFSSDFLRAAAINVHAAALYNWLHDNRHPSLPAPAHHLIISMCNQMKKFGVNNVRTPSDGPRLTTDEMAGYCAFVRHVCGVGFLSAFVRSPLTRAAIADTHNGR